MPERCGLCGRRIVHFTVVRSLAPESNVLGRLATQVLAYDADVLRPEGNHPHVYTCPGAWPDGRGSGVRPNARAVG